jgi:hypothetical protein
MDNANILMHFQGSENMPGTNSLKLSYQTL